MIENMYNITCDVIRRRISNDNIGGVVATYTPLHTDVPCYITRLKHRKSFRFGKDVVEADFLLFCRLPHTAIKTSDLVIAGGATWDVIWVDDCHYLGHHIEVYLRLLESPILEVASVTSTYYPWTTLLWHEMDVYDNRLTGQDAIAGAERMQFLRYARVPCHIVKILGGEYVKCGKTDVRVDARIFVSPLPAMQTGDLIHVEGEWFQVVFIDNCNNQQHHWEIYVAYIGSDAGDDGGSVSAGGGS